MNFYRVVRNLFVGFVFGQLTITNAHAATFIVDPTITTNGSLFHYDYSISNSTPGDDLILVDIPVPDPTKILNLAAPTGFQAVPTSITDPQTDKTVYFVTFLEDLSSFGPTPTSGFTFDSTLSAGPITFHATYLDPNGNLPDFYGPTMGPVVTPEPSSIILFMSGGVLIYYWRKTKGTPTFF